MGRMKDKTSSLRKRAEEFLNKNPEAVNEITSTDVKKLVEDLHIHQIELEIQNEELRRAQLELEASRDRYSELFDFAPVGYSILFGSFQKISGILFRGVSRNG
jgi:predicted nuclease with TOPRIM domain